jgi:hypothetical protein
MPYLKNKKIKKFIFLIPSLYSGRSGNLKIIFCCVNQKAGKEFDPI